MPGIRPIFPAFLVIVALATSPTTFGAGTDLLCTVSADGFPGFEDGTLQSRNVQLTGMQGEVGGQVNIYENATFRFRVVTGRSHIQGESVTLMDFYVEAQDLENDHSIRAASASYAGGPHHARLELVTYTPDSDWYEGSVIFKCSAPQ